MERNILSDIKEEHFDTSQPGGNERQALVTPLQVPVQIKVEPDESEPKLLISNCESCSTPIDPRWIEPRLGSVKVEPVTPGNKENKVAIKRERKKVHLRVKRSLSEDNSSTPPKHARILYSQRSVVKQNNFSFRKKSYFWKMRRPRPYWHKHRYSRYQSPYFTGYGGMSRNWAHYWNFQNWRNQHDRNFVKQEFKPERDIIVLRMISSVTQKESMSNVNFQETETFSSETTSQSPGSQIESLHEVEEHNFDNSNKENECDVDLSDKGNECDVDLSDKENEFDIDAADKENESDIDAVDEENERDIDAVDEESERDIDASDKESERDIDASDKENERDIDASDKEKVCDIDASDMGSQSDVDHCTKENSGDFEVFNEEKQDDTDPLNRETQSDFDLFKEESQDGIMDLEPQANEEICISGSVIGINNEQFLVLDEVDDSTNNSESQGEISSSNNTEFLSTDSNVCFPDFDECLNNNNRNSRTTYEDTEDVEILTESGDIEVVKEISCDGEVECVLNKCKEAHLCTKCFVQKRRIRKERDVIFLAKINSKLSTEDIPLINIEDMED